MSCRKSDCHNIVISISKVSWNALLKLAVHAFTFSCSTNIWLIPIFVPNVNVSRLITSRITLAMYKIEVVRNLFYQTLFSPIESLILSVCPAVKLCIRYEKDLGNGFLHPITLPITKHFPLLLDYY